MQRKKLGRPKTGHVNANFRITAKQHKFLRICAALDGTNMSAIVRLAIEGLSERPTMEAYRRMAEASK